ncbi:6-carboxytetrahydropterin synthase QueD [Staphylococcus hominis]|uniref:6-carboxytetrahydropterin synthase QueD n=1 Tax=Staphylococcus hominis TaxID=1290 RepID=UPI001F58FC33|nr:6-carboxytetrahydropterin synthase QueD [Staphylococcus hominis]MCI2840003.1 6-carboxytetrahydropterin synthase QueD [Staphylococcus hominis]MDS3832077.1 6-carboxytetrahydropterin synthase QueD [Staphylococcus hominis]
MIQQVYPTVNYPYTFELNKDFNFSAAHFIPSEDAGKCMRTHGHTYFVNLTIVGDTLDHNGFLINFSELKRLVHDQFDHYLLNDLPQFKDKSPSTEIVAQTIFEIVQAHLNEYDNKPKCVQVYLRETPSSYVVYRPKENK